MSPAEIGAAMFAGCLGLVALRVPVAAAMLVSAMVGYAGLVGVWPMLNALKTLTFSRFSSYTLSVIPLFLLMGEFASRGGLNRTLFAAARAWLGHRRGGLALAAIGGCAAFGAICGSSVATAATMSQVAAPEMRRAGYAGGLTTATLAAGGTLGILIPPSVILVIYAVYTEQSIGALFIAAVVPGLLAVLCYMAVVMLHARIVPASAPPAPRLPWRERLGPTLAVWPAAIVFALIVAGIYRGWFSPTEGAAIGALSVGALAVLLGGMRLGGLRGAILGTAETTGMMFVILVGAEFFSAALALSRMPAAFADWVAGLDAPPVLVLSLVIAAYFLLGTVMESLAMILLTLPVFVPLMLRLDFGMSPAATLVWFGILVLTSVEVGMISPPFGLNLFVISGMVRDVPITETWRAVIGFCAADVLRVGLLVAVPGLSLWLPGLS
ncbi:MAG: TRAP transporter large permease [Acetobacteraceae bacterium]